MSSESRVLANRRNAQRSTGPRTEEGKEIVSQNAVKHGLSAQRDVVRGEDVEEFDRHRRELLADLAPAGAMEAVLCQRIVSLSWRLTRAQRMQNMVLDVLFASEISDGTEDIDAWIEDDPGPQQGREALATDFVMGAAIKNDFACGKVLERMLAYEQRIEGSLYKAMAEFDKLRKARRADGAIVQNKANSVCSVPVRACPEPVERADGQTPDGVTTNVQNKANSQTGQTDAPTATEPVVTDSTARAGEAAVENKANSPSQEPDRPQASPTGQALPFGT